MSLFLCPLDEDDDGAPSLVKTLFPNPDTISAGEYSTIYEFLLDPDIRNDRHMIAGVLQEFAGWAEYMLNIMRKRGLADPEERRQE